MSKIQKKIMERFFRQAAGDPERLPWHDETLSPYVAKALEARSGPRTALDVGCGSGVLAAHMAALGLEVTAVDYLADAIEMAHELTGERGANVELVHADVLGYTPEQPFSLVFDSGCLHNMSGQELRAYRRQLLQWLAPGGDYVLGHWGRRHALDWRPIGPRRRKPAELERLLPDELELVDFQYNDEKVPLPFGPRVRMASYWFQRRC